MKGGPGMEDSRIVDLYLERNEDAIRETKEKYLPISLFANDMEK